MEANAVGDPRTMVVHLQDAPVALAAVVTSVGLGAQTPLAHSHATQMLTFNRGLQQFFGLGNCLGGARAQTSVILSFRCARDEDIFVFLSALRLVHRARLGLEINVVELLSLTRILNVLFDLVIDQVPT